MFRRKGIWFLWKVGLYKMENFLLGGKIFELVNFEEEDEGLIISLGGRVLVIKIYGS